MDSLLNTIVLLLGQGFIAGVVVATFRADIKHLFLRLELLTQAFQEHVKEDKQNFREIWPHIDRRAQLKD